MSGLRALIWDVDGTLAETECDGHRIAFNQAFEAAGLDWHWDDSRYGELLAVTGGRERLLHDMATRDDAPPQAAQRESLAAQLHRHKNEAYAALVREGRIALRDGVAALMQECREQGVRMAIATTTSASNVDALLRSQLGDGWTAAFSAVVCGADVQRKKPDPEVYRRVLEALAIAPSEALALEDSPDGASAATAAGIAVVVTRSRYFASAPIPTALAIGPGLHRRDGWQPALAGAGGTGARVGLADLRSLMAGRCARAVSHRAS